MKDGVIKGSGSMQIRLTFTCRECGQDRELLTDTSNYGVVFELDPPALAGVTASVDDGCLLELKCMGCGHVSGEVVPGYRYRAERRPSHEQEVVPTNN